MAAIRHPIRNRRFWKAPAAAVPVQAAQRALWRQVSRKESIPVVAHAHSRDGPGLRPGRRAIPRAEAGRLASGAVHAAMIPTGAFLCPLPNRPNSNSPRHPNTSPGAKRARHSLVPPRQFQRVRPMFRDRRRPPSLRAHRKRRAIRSSPRPHIAAAFLPEAMPPHGLRRAKAWPRHLALTAGENTAEVNLIQPQKKAIRGRHVLCRIRDQTGLRQVAPTDRPGLRNSTGSWNCSYVQTSRFRPVLQEEAGLVRLLHRDRAIFAKRPLVFDGLVQDIGKAANIDVALDRAQQIGVRAEDD